MRSNALPQAVKGVTDDEIPRRFRVDSDSVRCRWGHSLTMSGWCGCHLERPGPEIMVGVGDGSRRGALHAERNC